MNHVDQSQLRFLGLHHHHSLITFYEPLFFLNCTKTHLFYFQSHPCGIEWKLLYLSYCSFLCTGEYLTASAYSFWHCPWTCKDVQLSQITSNTNQYLESCALTFCWWFQTFTLNHMNFCGSTYIPMHVHWELLQKATLVGMWISTSKGGCWFCF